MTISVRHKKLAVGLSLEKIVICEIRILQLFLESWFSAVRKGFGSFIATFKITQYHYIVKASQKKLALRAIFKKFVIYEILHFTTFARILVFNAYKRIRQFCSSLYHCTITTTKPLRQPTVRVIFIKTCNLRNLPFYKL